MREWIDIATLTKTKNSKEGFVAQYATGLSFIPSPGVEVAFVPPRTDMPRRAVVAFSQQVNDRSFDIAFEGLEDMSVREDLLGSHCLVRRALVGPECFEGAGSPIVSFEVRDEDGDLLGIVREVLSNPAQELLSIERTDNGEELLLPWVEEFILEVDEDAGSLTVHLPEGLLDL